MKIKTEVSQNKTQIDKIERRLIIRGFKKVSGKENLNPYEFTIGDITDSEAPKGHQNKIEIKWCEPY